MLDIEKLQFNYFLMLCEAMEKLEAREMIMKLEISSYPNMANDDDRKRILSKYMDKIQTKDNTNEITTEELARILNHGR